MSTPAAQLAAATDALSRSDGPDALAAMLTAWRQQKLLRLALLIEHLSPTLESAAATALRTSPKKRLPTADWLALADTETDRSALMACLGKGTMKDARARLDAVCGWEADPRVSGVLIEWEKNPPYTSTSAGPVRTRVGRALDKVSDPRRRRKHALLQPSAEGKLKAALDALQVAVERTTGTALPPVWSRAPADIRREAIAAAQATPTAWGTPVHATEHALTESNLAWVASCGATTILGSVEVKPDSGYTSSEDRLRTFVVVDTETGAARGALWGWTLVDFVDDGARMVVRKQHTLRLLDAKTLAVEAEIDLATTSTHFSGGQGLRHTVASHPSQPVLAVLVVLEHGRTNNSYLLGLWEPETGALAWIVQKKGSRSPSSHNFLRFSADGRRLVAIAPDDAIGVDLTRRQVDCVVSDVGYVGAVALSADGTRADLIASSFKPPTHRQWDTTNGWLSEPQPLPETTGYDYFLSLDETDPGALLLCNHRQGYRDRWVLRTRDDPAEVAIPEIDGARVYRCSPGRLMVTADERPTAVLVEASSQRILQRFPTHLRAVAGAAATTGRVAAWAGSRLMIFGGKKPKLVKEKARITDASFSPDGAVLAVAVGSGVRLYPVSRGRKRLLSANRRAINKLSWRADGVLAAAGAALQIWSDGELSAETPLPGKAVHTIAWHPGGQLVAAALGRYGAVLRAPDDPTLLLRTDRPARWVACSPDGALLYAADTDSLSCWDIASTSAKWQVTPPAPIASLAVHPSGTVLVGHATGSVSAATSQGLTPLITGLLGPVSSIAATATELVLGASRDGTGSVSCWRLEHGNGQ